MKFKKVLNEALRHDPSDQNTGGWNYYLNGRTKHVKEDIGIHILNFQLKKDNINITYIKRESEYKPKNKNTPQDEVYLKKGNLGIKYEGDPGKYEKREFSTLDEFYAFVHNEYVNGNKWPRNLMEKMSNKGRNLVDKKTMYFKKGVDKTTHHFDTIESEVDRLEQSIKFLLREYGVDSIQNFISLRKTPYDTKVKYGDSKLKDIDQAYKNLYTQLKLVS